MTIDDLKALARKYDDAIQFAHSDIVHVGRGISSIDRSSLLDLGGPNRSDRFLEHARWMCKLMQEFDDAGKLKWWLGFVQCVLLEQHIFRFDELKEHVKEYS